jgi:hypothetical protein
MISKSKVGNRIEQTPTSIFFLKLSCPATTIIFWSKLFYIYQETCLMFFKSHIQSTFRLNSPHYKVVEFLKVYLWTVLQPSGWDDLVARPRSRVWLPKGVNFRVGVKRKSPRLSPRQSIGLRPGPGCGRSHRATVPPCKDGTGVWWIFSTCVKKVFFLIEYSGGSYPYRPSFFIEGISYHKGNMQQDSIHNGTDGIDCLDKNYWTSDLNVYYYLPQESFQSFVPLLEPR